MYEIQSRRLCSQVLTSLIFLVLFSKNQLDFIDIEDIGNLEDSPGLVFIDEECGNLIVVNDGAELTRNINQMKKSDVLQ